MNSADIQKLIDMPNAAGAVKLPAGEFEGPFVISRPCVITGNETTLWRRSGTVLDIRSRGVVLRSTDIEITGAGSGIAVSCAADDTCFRDVSVYGDVRGIPGEQEHWDIPRVMSLGNIPPDSEFTAFAEVYVPVGAELRVNISGVKAEPAVLSPGTNTIKLIVEPLSEGTVIYGDIEFRSVFIRKAYITLSASSAGEPSAPGKYLFRASSSAPAPQQHAITEQPQPKISAVYENADVSEMIRGQRIEIAALGDSEITAELETSFTGGRTLDIDGYAFLLDTAGKADNDKSLVFFGNPSGAGGAVTYTDENGKRFFKFELDRVPQNVDKIAVAFSIYGDDPADNFSRVRNTVFRLRGGKKTVLFRMDGFFLEKTIVAAEIYRRKDSWKISAVGQGYSQGLRRLCESYGLNVI